MLSLERQVRQDLGRRLERHDLLDPLVPNPIGMALHKGPYLASHCSSRCFLKSRWKSYVAYGGAGTASGGL